MNYRSVTFIGSNNTFALSNISEDDVKKLVELSYESNNRIKTVVLCDDVFAKRKKGSDYLNKKLNLSVEVVDG